MTLLLRHSITPKIKYILSIFGQSLSRCIYPHTCVVCGLELFQGISVICDHCVYTYFGKVHYKKTNYASSIITYPSSISYHYALWTYDKYGYLAKIMYMMKYTNAPELANRMGMYLYDMIYNKDSLCELFNDESSLLVPIPLHFKRFKERGYNQSYLIAKTLSSKFNTTIVESGVIDRVRYTKTQTKLSGDMRIKNMENAFEINKNMFGDRHVILIDDIFTTGATTFELAKTIMSISKPKSIGIISLALTSES